MPNTSSRVLSRNGLRSRGADLRSGGTATGVVATASRTVKRCFSYRLLLRIQQILQLGHELADVAELAVDGCEPHVGDFVQATELVHHQTADLVGAHLLLRPVLECGFDLVGNT